MQASKKKALSTTTAVADAVDVECYMLATCALEIKSHEATRRVANQIKLGLALHTRKRGIRLYRKLVCRYRGKDQERIV